MAKPLSEKPFRIYYVTGKDSRGEKRTVKTEARTPTEARANASYVLDTPGRVTRG